LIRIILVGKPHVLVVASVLKVKAPDVVFEVLSAGKVRYPVAFGQLKLDGKGGLSQERILNRYLSFRMLDLLILI
jgi:hypothetical protein